MKWKYGWIVLKMGESFVSIGNFYLTFALIQLFSANIYT